MTPKNILQILKSNLETDSQFGDNNVNVQLQSSEKVAKATVQILVEGKVRLVEVWAKDLGLFEGLRFSN